MEEAIREKLEELRGMLQADGGDLEVVSITGKTVLLRLRGACGACPHAQMTLKDGIERILRSSSSFSLIASSIVSSLSLGGCARCVEAALRAAFVNRNTI